MFVSGMIIGLLLVSNAADINDAATVKDYFTKW